MWRYLVGEGDPVLLFLILLAGTGSEAFLEEADLFAERVDAIQLLEGVGQEAGFLRHALVQRHGEQTGERGQDQLELLLQQLYSVLQALDLLCYVLSQPIPSTCITGGGSVIVCCFLTGVGGRGRRRKVLTGVCVSCQPVALSTHTVVAACHVHTLMRTGLLLTALIHICLAVMTHPSQRTGAVVGS